MLQPHESSEFVTTTDCAKARENCLGARNTSVNNLITWAVAIIIFLAGGATVGIITLYTTDATHRERIDNLGKRVDMVDDTLKNLQIKLNDIDSNVKFLLKLQQQQGTDAASNDYDLQIFGNGVLPNEGRVEFPGKSSSGRPS